MSLKTNGTKQERVKVTGVGNKGVSLDIHGKEYHMSYKDFPWLGSLTAQELGNIYIRYEDEIYFPDLDIELGLEILENPKKYPLLMDPILKVMDTLPRNTGAVQTIREIKESTQNVHKEASQNMNSFIRDIMGNLHEVGPTVVRSKLVKYLKEAEVSIKSDVVNKITAGQGLGGLYGVVKKEKSVGRKGTSEKNH